jgi:hypothetical protein
VAVGVGQQHVARAIDERGPSGPARVVGDLLVAQAGQRRRPQVERRLVVYPDVSQLPAHPLVVLDRDGVALRRRCESRDRALEEQLIADGVAAAELDEGARPRPRPGDRIGGEGVVADGGVHVGGELPIRLEEHGVEDLVLRGEVGVDRLGPHADPFAEIAHGQPGETVLPDELPGGGDDLALGLLPARCPPVDVRSS